MSTLNFDFSQLSADGSTAPVNVPLDGTYSLFAFGTFGTGTLTIEASPDKGTTWFAVVAFTANGRESHYLSANEIIRATLSGATAPTVDSGAR